MITISKGELEQNLQKYLRQVEETGEEIIVTRDKIPVVKIVSIKDADDYMVDEGKVKHHGSLLEKEKQDWEEF